ncbi:MAG: nitrilase family protein [Planctomycetota bacterium]|jgi:predicted amidohydrolase
MPPTYTLRAATVQFHHLPGDKPYNLSVLRDFTQQAADQDVRVLCFPEMCITGYWHVRNLTPGQIDGLAEPVDTDLPDNSGPSVQALRQLSREYNLMLGAGLIERAEDGQLYNTFVVALPDGSLYAHRKLHCFVSPHMASGDSYTVFDVPADALGGAADETIRFGVLICWDNNLVENARMMGLSGVDVLLAPHQTGGCDTRSPHAMGLIDPALWHNREHDPDAIEAEMVGPKGRGWLMRWLPTRAHDNGMFILFANGVGEDDGEVRTGNAMILDCYGRAVSETKSADDTMVVADLDLSLLELCTGRRWMKGRRPELYAKIAQATGNELDIRNVRFDDRPGKPAK